MNFSFRDEDLVYLQSAGSFEFSIWADEGTPAADMYVTYPPIFRSDTADTAPFILQCLSACRTQHESCTLGASEDPAAEDSNVELPSRVLAIGKQGSRISVKLAESRGLRGSYCALSHCWGPEDRRPLKTTLNNLRQHLTTIPWNKLPKTFRDATALTQQLGISYLWIDSLCIIQDDLKDWEIESKQMAFVCKRATVVIAAVSANDSTEGLHKAERPDPLAFRLVHRDSEGVTAGSYNIALDTSGEAGSEGPLKQRAWALQEWSIGRRVVFFTSKGVSWGCRFRQWNERGTNTDLNFDRPLPWLKCLQVYTSKSLTFPSDRIIAVSGIACEYESERNTGFVADLGVWESWFEGQLLWTPVTAAHRTADDLHHLPSWCWAATGGGKRRVPRDSFLHEARVKDKVTDTAQTITLGANGTATARGPLLRAKTASSPIKECCIQYYRQCIPGDRWQPEADVLPSDPTQGCNMDAFLIFDVDDTSRILGIARFDRSTPVSEIFCLVLELYSQQRSRSDEL
ncbi:heterokaryon incompatibility protein-domain-containing protein [Stachybotrys elegans]|uniref:Heterokaryon incompatibility protein-domain-containing protein n=1 Tax=Stachybotrys elegans TaxID=80388 RepID=A0A8K0SJQ8_9HYPO|nr:heterokaryon incompatibility protein-domain-containing protein [Stachybotrys elegans]